MTFFYACICLFLTLLFLAALPLLVPIAIVAGILTLILDRKDPHGQSRPASPPRT